MSTSPRPNSDARQPAGAAPTAAGPATTAPRALVVGGEDLDPRTLLVLHSLLRVLDGRDGLRLRASERRDECDLLFVPADWPHRTDPRRIVVRVCDEAGDAARLAGPGLRVVAPLRLSNVTPVLQACLAAQRADEARDDAARDLVSLYHALARHLMARDRRTQVFGLRPTGTLVVDFGLERVQVPGGLEALLSGQARLVDAPPHRADESEREAAASLPQARLRDLVWRLSRRLGEAGAPGGAPDGRYQMVRWPDAVALAEPGVPRLAALLTNRAMSLEAAATASGLAVPRVRWFLQTALACGVALCVDDEGRALARVSGGAATAGPRAAVAPPAHRPAGPVSGTVPRSLLGRLRQHLRLW